MKAGWEVRPLGEVVSIIGGGTPPKNNPAYYNGSIPWATVRDMNVEMITATDHSITQAGLTASSSKIIPAGEVVIASRVGLGKVCILGQDTAINQDLRGLVPRSRKALDRRFLYYWYKSAASLVVDAGTGATVQGVTLPFLKALPIPLPPLEEQERIVAILDEAFEGLARARAHAEANLQNARELFERYLADQFVSGGFGRKACPIGSLITLQRGFDITKKDQVEGQFPVVSSGGIKSYHSQAMAKAPGVVIGRKGSIGSVYFIESDYWPHDTTLWVKDFKGNDARLVYYLLRGIKLIELDTGAANPSLNRNLVHPIKVSWPTGDDQANVAAKIVSVESRSLELQDRYQTKLRSLDALRQSLLQKAFAGELT